MLHVNRVTMKQVEKFKYLGVAFTSEERQDEELDTRIDKASAVIRALHYSVVIKRELSKKTKLSIFKTIFVPINTYKAVVETDSSETKTETKTAKFFRDQDWDQDRSRSQFWLRDRDR